MSIFWLTPAMRPASSLCRCGPSARAGIRLKNYFETIPVSLVRQPPFEILLLNCGGRETATA
ncbi:hypothetical protein ONA91_32610 [Micromonospora sp. DR5-3]|uniref:hypothetical protein n=1 Tax=unclassified Micromonospora TaxID=2617518 RepID=UPI001651B4AE|nr:MULTISPECIES: hypothetical protein [unclassified Micromonospora]MCW3819194.1 hypothetical protein [Micromonospora sp. DR5-3]